MFQTELRNRYRAVESGCKTVGKVGGIVVVGVAAFVLALAFACTAPSPAEANFDFSAPATLSEASTGPFMPQVVVDTQDRATVVWEAEDPITDALLVQAKRISADGVPGPVQTLSSVLTFAHGECRCPQAVVDSEDRVTVAWQVYDGTDFRIRARRLSADGVLGPVQELSESGKDGSGQHLTVDSLGRVTVVWRLIGSADVIQAVRLDASGVPGTVETLGPADGGPKVAIDQLDRATVVWESPTGIEATRLAADSTPGPAQTLSPSGESAVLPQVVVDSLGRATVVWLRMASTYEVKSVRLGADGTPEPVQTLSPEGQDTLDPRIAIDSENRVLVTWEDFSQRINVVRLRVDGTPGPVYPFSGPSTSAGHPRVATGTDGKAVVTWSHPPLLFIPPEFGQACADGEFDAESDAVKAAAVNPDGSPGQVQTVSPLGEQAQEAQVAFDSQGRIRVVWHSFDGTFFCPDEFATRVQSSLGSPLVEIPRHLDVLNAGTGQGTITGPGINCGSDCEESYADGSFLVLTATASPGSAFTGWSGGGCSGTGACPITMTADQSVTATFNPVACLFAAGSTCETRRPPNAAEKVLWKVHSINGDRTFTAVTAPRRCVEHYRLSSRVVERQGRSLITLFLHRVDRDRMPRCRAIRRPLTKRIRLSRPLDRVELYDAGKSPPQRRALPASVPSP